MKIFTQKLYLPVEREQKLKEFEEQIEKMILEEFCLIKKRNVAEYKDRSSFL